MRLTVRGRHGRALRDLVVLLLLPYQDGSIGAGFGAQLLSGRTKRRHKLSTLAQDAMLSAPDELDRLSRRFDAARNNRGPFPQSRKPS